MPYIILANNYEDKNEQREDVQIELVLEKRLKSSNGGADGSMGSLI